MLFPTKVSPVKKKKTKKVPDEHCESLCRGNFKLVPEEELVNDMEMNFNKCIFLRSYATDVLEERLLLKSRTQMAFG